MKVDRSTSVLGVLALVGCASWLPSDAEQKRIALGGITVATPLFTPCQRETELDRKLIFGDLRTTGTLARRLNTPSTGISRLSYAQIAGALRIALAGPQISSSVTRTTTESVRSALGADGTITTTGDSARGQDGKETRSFNSPSVPTGEAAIPEVPAWAVELFKEMLGASGFSYQLRPDQEATLVAAMQNYMLGLEDFYNLRGLEKAYTDEGGRSWEPYRVQIAVTADPGWWTRYHGFDGVVDLAFGGESSTRYRVVAVTPAETAQALQELQSTFRSMAGLLAGQGAYAEAAVDAQVSALRAAAQRLEGLRTNTTLIVSCPKQNTVRLRFRPEILPNIGGRDLQPNARLITMTVLVSSTVPKADRLAPDASVQALVTQAFQEHPEAPAVEFTYSLSEGLDLGTTSREELAAKVKEARASREPLLVRADANGELGVTCWFEPSLDVEQSGWLTDGGDHVLPCYLRQGKEGGPGSTVNFVVPKRPNPPIPPLAIDATGFFFPGASADSWSASVAYGVTGVQTGATIEVTSVPPAPNATGTTEEGTLTVTVPKPADPRLPMRFMVQVTEKKDGKTKSAVAFVALQPFQDRPPSGWLQLDKDRLDVRDPADVQIQIQTPGANQTQGGQEQGGQGQNRSR